MQIVAPFLVPEVTVSLLAVLGLLSLWQYHQNHVLAGRIYALDFWDVSGIRLLLHATTWDSGACQACREAHGTAFLPPLATQKQFSTLRHPCSSPRGCRCLVVGLHGGWTAANRLIETLRKQAKNTSIKLKGEEVVELFEGPWRGSHTVTTDEVTIRMVQALHLEGTDPQAAISHYHYVVDQASGARDLHWVVPAYLRLAELLQRVGRLPEALEVIDQFEKRFAWKRAVFYYPNDAQRQAMSVHKSRLPAGREKGPPAAPPLKLQGRANRAPPSIWR